MQTYLQQGIQNFLLLHNRLLNDVQVVQLLG